MEILIAISKSMAVVAQSDYFYQAMAAVTIIAMFIGSLLYNGDLNQLRKASLTIFTYGGLIVLTNMSRIISFGASTASHLIKQGQAFNGTSTVIYVTLFYLFGLRIGVSVHRRARKGHNA
jgi:hypothetical protein